jgi:hypothetical protein
MYRTVRLRGNRWGDVRDVRTRGSGDEDERVSLTEREFHELLCNRIVFVHNK